MSKKRNEIIALPVMYQASKIAEEQGAVVHFEIVYDNRKVTYVTGDKSPRLFTIIKGS